ncbi:hypothetical protein Ddye_023843 [Dipteronia dyeriana]|uniref:Putative plant transposon protein domain-containing protein n=1 Tax=Dipteronia dyeriana TaxID=168575 RepID=A0AAD9TTM4_9ROSI|nr:hypothetical protein Ddye_023843 [Dipteronia dyeriana]
MVPKRFLNGGAVLVQGVEVHILPDAINQYFATPKVRVNSNSGINTIDDIDQHLERLAEVLRMDGRAEWNQMVRLYQRDLRVDVAFWNIFISYSLKPSQHRKELFFEPTRLLHRLVTGRPINIDRVIFRVIYNSGCEDGSSIVFPCLITTFYRTTGIEVDAGLEEHAPSMLLLTLWNKLCHDRRLSTMGQYGERRRRRQEREAQLQMKVTDPIPEDHTDVPPVA